MKVKTDFITNSSSSFVSVHISCDKLMEILNKYKTAFEALNNNYYSTYLPEFFDDDLSMEKRGLPACSMHEDDNLALSVYCKLDPELSDDSFDLRYNSNDTPPKTKEDIFSLLLDIVSKLSELNPEKYPFIGIVEDLNEGKEEIFYTLKTFEYTISSCSWEEVSACPSDGIEYYAREYLGLSDDEVIDEETFESFYIEAEASMGTTTTYFYNGEEIVRK